MKILESRRVCRLPWLALYAAFVVAAVLLRRHMAGNGLREIWGWDYATFVGQINDWRWIAYTGFRHPGLGVVASPLVALQHLWSGAYLLVMPAVAVATGWCIWRLGGWISVLIWLAMPTTWILAGTPESFPLAQLALAASALHLAAEPGERRVVGIVSAGALAALNSMVTITNGAKVALGWLVTRARRKDLAWLAAGGGLVVLAGVLFFAVRAHLNGKDWMDGIRATLAWVPAERCWTRELWGFFVRPVGWAAVAAYPLAAWGLWRNRKLAKVFGAFFAIDLVIHVVIGWGMKEPWVFAPHWSWMLAAAAGQGLRLKKGVCDS